MLTVGPIALPPVEGHAFGVSRMTTTPGRCQENVQIESAFKDEVRYLKKDNDRMARNIIECLVQCKSDFDFLN
jgi:hypothetical protein